MCVRIIWKLVGPPWNFSGSANGYSKTLETNSLHLPYVLFTHIWVAPRLWVLQLWVGLLFRFPCISLPFPLYPIISYKQSHIICSEYLRIRDNGNITAVSADEAQSHWLRSLNNVWIHCQRMSSSNSYNP